MAWTEKRSQVQAKLDEWAQGSLESKTIDQLQLLRSNYETERHTLTSYLKSSANEYNLSDKLKETGQIQTHIQQLHDENDKMKTDVETALARDELLRSKDQTGNGHTLYVLDRPIRRGMIPYLWVLAVLFVGIGVLLFYWLTPMILLPVGPNMNQTPIQTGSSILTMLMEILTDRTIWIGLFIAACIVILFLSLKIAGVFGK